MEENLKKPGKSRLLTVVLLYILALFIVSVFLSVKKGNTEETSPAMVCAFARQFIADDSLTETGKSFDCSKYTQTVYKKFGIDIPRSSAQQFEAFAVDNNKKKAGDLVFFSTDSKKIGHVGIYLGGNKFIHSPGKGEKVKIDDITDDNWNSHYAGSGSVIGSKKANDETSN